tara:strand:+ start:89 stop:1744 length:1656 start_codon:yes stop_codon:yes gene_type:complete
MGIINLNVITKSRYYFVFKKVNLKGNNMLDTPRCMLVSMLSCFIVSIISIDSAAQSNLVENYRYFDTTSSLLNEPCVTYSGDHYTASFDLQSFGSGYSLIINKADLLPSTTSVNFSSVNDKIKDCAGILTDWWGKTRYQIFDLSLYEAQLDLQRKVTIRAVSNPDEPEKGFEIINACSEDTTAAEYLVCIGFNKPTLNPEHYIMIGPSDKIPSFYGEDITQILNWFIEMGLGYDRMVHVIYELDDDNDSMLNTLKALGVTHKQELLKNIDELNEVKACLSGFARFNDHNSRKRSYTFCNQLNPYTDKDWPWSREQLGDGFFHYMILEGLLEEYFHHAQTAHTLDRYMGTADDCCGNHYPLNALPFYSEGIAGVFKELFLWEKFDELNHTKRNNYKRGNGVYSRQPDSPIVCQKLTTYLCDQGIKWWQETRRKHRENGGKCYLGSRGGIDLVDGTVKSPQCDWILSAYYLAYITSFQTMWVDIQRDMWAMGFPEAFEKHVGMTINEFAESFSEFMNSGSLEDPPPTGFYPVQPLSELVDFWDLQTNPSGPSN